MKLHMLSALMVLIVGMTLPFSVSERASLLFAIGAVWFAEILNTGLEALIDLYTQDFHRLALVSKDATAAGVLVLSFVAALIFADVVVHRIDLILANLDVVFRAVLFGLPLVFLEAVGLFVHRRGRTGVARLFVSLALAGALAYYATNLIFSIFAILIILINAYARSAFPARAGRGAPPDVAAS